MLTSSNVYFLFFEPSIEGSNNCSPIMSIDSPLYSKYEGSTKTAIGVDVND